MTEHRPLFTSTELALPGIFLITPILREDERGTSASMYQRDEFAGLGIHSTFVQDYVSYSKKGVIRGLHFQRAPHAQDKLIRCAVGTICDIVVDHAPGSPTFSQHVAIELDAKEGNMLFVPGHYAHGFCVLSNEGALVEYKLSDGYHPELAGGIRYNDPFFAIAWPVVNPIISTQDASWSLFKV